MNTLYILHLDKQYYHFSIFAFYLCVPPPPQSFESKFHPEYCVGQKFVQIFLNSKIWMNFVANPILWHAFPKSQIILLHNHKTINIPKKKN